MLSALQFRGIQRRALAVVNESTPPDITVSVFVRQYRHNCPAQGGRSVALELREHYAFSPGKRFGFIWTEGRCTPCGMTARSGTGRLVDASVRPPAQHSIVTP